MATSRRRGLALSLLSNDGERKIPGDDKIFQAFDKKDTQKLEEALRENPALARVKLCHLSNTMIIKREGDVAHFAVLIGWTQALDVIKACGLPLNTKHHLTGRRLFDTAISQCKPTVVKKLLALGVDPHPPRTMSPFVILAHPERDKDKMLKIAQLLLNAGVDPWRLWSEAPDNSTGTTLQACLDRGDIRLPAFLAARGKAPDLPQARDDLIKEWLTNLERGQPKEHLAFFQGLAQQGWLPSMASLAKIASEGGYVGESRTICVLIKERALWPIEPDDAKMALGLLETAKGPYLDPIRAELSEIVLQQDTNPVARASSQYRL